MTTDAEFLKEVSNSIRHSEALGQETLLSCQTKKRLLSIVDKQARALDVARDTLDGLQACADMTWIHTAHHPFSQEMQQAIKKALSKIRELKGE